MATATQSTHKKERGPHLGKGADQGLSRFLDAEKRSATACQFEHAMREKIAGQDEAVQALVDIYQVFCAGLHSPGRPVGNLLFLGRFRENAHCRSRGRDSVRREPGGNQSGLRGIPALPRNCEIDWFAARISGAPRNAPAYHARSVGRKPPRAPETEFFTVRRD